MDLEKQIYIWNWKCLHIKRLDYFFPFVWIGFYYVYFIALYFVCILFIVCDFCV